MVEGVVEGVDNRGGVIPNKPLFGIDNGIEETGVIGEVPSIESSGDLDRVLTLLTVLRLSYLSGDLEKMTLGVNGTNPNPIAVNGVKPIDVAVKWGVAVAVNWGVAVAVAVAVNWGVDWGVNPIDAAVNVDVAVNVDDDSDVNDEGSVATTFILLSVIGISIGGVRECTSLSITKLLFGVVILVVEVVEVVAIISSDSRSNN